MLKGENKEKFRNSNNKNNIEKTDENQLVENIRKHIIDGIQDKKGLDIVCIDLQKINNSICDYFVICHGTSNTHVEAIAGAVEDMVRDNTRIKPALREGYANAEWILLDYLDIVVHIFQQETRDFYQLEALWADAPITRIDNI